MIKMERMEPGSTQQGTGPRAACVSRPTRPQSPASASSKAENVQDPSVGAGTRAARALIGWRPRRRLVLFVVGPRT